MGQDDFRKGDSWTSPRGLCCDSGQESLYTLDVTRNSWLFVILGDRQLSGQEDQRLRRRETGQGILWI